MALLKAILWKIFYPDLTVKTWRAIRDILRRGKEQVDDSTDEWTLFI